MAPGFDGADIAQGSRGGHAVMGPAEAPAVSSPENGLRLMGLGLFISGLGWLATIAPRFTHKLPA